MAFGFLKRPRSGDGGRPWSGEMAPEVCGSGPKLDYPRSMYSSVNLRWASLERDAEGRPVRVREPSESRRTYPVSSGFTAAGMRYRDIRQLYVEHDRYKTFCRDVYGREVLYLAERFPCFDSHDYATETRFYRWFFLRQDDRLTRIHYTDETDKIYVTEDVQYLEEGLWAQMRYHRYFEQDTGPLQQPER